MRAVIYVRVSTDGQERDGTSLASQEAACRALAESAGWQVVACIRDTASGFTLDRPGMAHLRQLLRQREVDVLLAYAVDRLSRNQNHIGVLFDEVEQASARLECVTEKFADTPEGRFILAARAFIAEVERAKILERTSRGKLARARAGKLPQATGKGLYGYRYNQVAGKRELDPVQAAVVQRIFQRYTETRSFSAVAQELNEAGLPAFCGGRWYPLTVRRILTNATYTGRTIFRRTRRVVSRDPASGQRRSRVVERPLEEWVEVPEGTPRIIDPRLWDHVQRIITDPERLRRRPEGRFYLLGSRVRCGLCGAAMVGQTLTVKGKAFQYYRCRHAYNRNSGHPCRARYVRGPELEQAIWREIQDVLSNPAIVVHELKAQRNQKVDAVNRSRLERERAALRARERRLVRLYGLGEVDEAIVREELTAVRRQQALVETQLQGLSGADFASAEPHIDEDMVARVCAAVRAWLERAPVADRTLVLEALQISVEATREGATMTGVLPGELPAFLTDDGSCRCSCNGEYWRRGNLRHLLPGGIQQEPPRRVDAGASP
jgi:site-specific DNA recombinase